MRFWALLLWLPAFAFSRAALSAGGPVRVLFWGGTNTATHNARALRDTLAPVFAANDLVLNYREAASHSWLRADSLAQYDVAFLYTTDQTGSDLSPDQLSAFTAWIEAGHVAVAFHGSTNTYLNNGAVSAAWGNLLGGLFLDHGNGSSDNGGTITYQQPVHAALGGTAPPPASASASGGSPYWDEGRRHKSFTSDTVVLARSRMNTVDTATPWIWLRPQGLGWVYYNASGHDGQSWKRPEFKAQVVQALKWGASFGTTVVRGGFGNDRRVHLSQDDGSLWIPDARAVTVRDYSGRVILSSNSIRGTRVDLSKLPVGFYSLDVITKTESYRTWTVRKP